MFIISSSPDNDNLQGICINCRYSEGCFIRQYATNAIWQCNQYAQEKTFGYNEKTTQLQEEKVVGLCMNCDHVKNCSLRHEGKVIFHCEEYE